MSTLNSVGSVLIIVLGLSAGLWAGQSYGEEQLIQGKICYRVGKDESQSPRRTEVEGEDEAVGKRPMQVRTRKARLVCDRALIRVKKLLE